MAKYPIKQSLKNLSEIISKQVRTGWMDLIGFGCIKMDLDVFRWIHPGQSD